MTGPFTVELGGITFGAVDDQGVTWVVSRLAGWDTPSSSGTVSQRTMRDGGWRNRAHYGARGLTLDGSVIARRPGELGDALDRLSAAIPLDVPQPLTVSGLHASPRFVSVRQEGDPDVEITSPYDAVFSVGLVAPDPLKYSQAQHVTSTALPTTTGGLTVPFTVPLSIRAVTVSGVVTAHNGGNVTTYPRVIVSGPVSAPRLTNVTTGETLTVALDIPDGRYVDLDMARHTALLAGTASRRGYVSGRWWGLVPGPNQIAFNSPAFDPTASLRIVWRDAWK